MSDRSPAIAAFMIEARGSDPDDAVRVLRARWPDLGLEELRLAFGIAHDTMRADAAELLADLDALAFLRRPGATWGDWPSYRE